MKSPFTWFNSLREIENIMKIYRSLDYCSKKDLRRLPLIPGPYHPPPPSIHSDPTKLMDRSNEMKRGRDTWILLTMYNFCLTRSAVGHHNTFIYVLVRTTCNAQTQECMPV